MSTYSATVLQDGPALYWRLGEPSGTNANDETANNRDGTYQDTPTLGVAGALTGDADTAVAFGGASDYVSSTYAPFTNGTVRTYEGWANRTNTTGYQPFFSGSSGAPCWMFSEPGLTTTINFAANSSGTWYQWTSAWPGNGVWAHYALVFDEPADIAELYVNGVSKGTKAVTDQYSGAGNIRIGSFPASTWWVGSLDEFAVYEFRLSAARITHHYNVGKGRIGVPKRRLIRPVLTPLSGAGYR